MLLISPHLDDAALSCAARLARGDIAQVITVFAGLPKADEPLTTWDAVTRAKSTRQRMVERRAEDESAWRSVDQSSCRWDYVEAEADRLDTHQLALDISAAAHGHGTVLLPAGVGGHPHHVLVRDAGLSALDGTTKILLYGELPYAAYFGWPTQDPHLDVEAYWRSELVGVAPGRLGTPTLTNLTPGERAWKRTLLGYYSSQMAAVGGGSLNLFERTALLDHEVEFALA